MGSGAVEPRVLTSPHSSQGMSKLMNVVMEVVKELALAGFVLLVEQEHGWPAVVLGFWLLMVVGAAWVAQSTVRVAPGPVFPVSQETAAADVCAPGGGADGKGQPASGVGATPAVVCGAVGFAVGCVLARRASRRPG